MMESSRSRYVSPEDVSVEMVGLTSKAGLKSLKPWSRTSYNIVRNHKNHSVVDDDDKMKAEEDRSMTRRRIPQWGVCFVLIVASLLVATVLVTVSVLPMVGPETTAATKTVMMVKLTTTPTSVLTAKNENSCLSGEFWCGTTADLSECIPGEWRCDGTVECTTGRDEKYCEDFQLTTTPKVVQPRPCVAWQRIFNESCELPASTAAQCEYVPQCQADGSRWASLQCTMDRMICWCVDQDYGKTLPGTFVGVDVLIDGKVSNCL